MTEDDDLESLPPGLAAAWGVVAPEGRRGPKPAHTVDEVIEVAAGLADAEGLAGVSLPKVAARVGVTANALYRYVSSKDELVVLLADRAWGDPPALPDGEWREAAAVWARRLFERFGERPWLLDVPTTVPLTPHNAAWLDALLAALAPTRMPAHELLDCAYLLDSHARYGANLRRNAPTPAALRRGNPRRAEASRAVRGFLDDRLRDRGLDAAADVLGDPVFLADEPSVDGFEFGLARILDGIEAHVGR
ncbi:TetR/AcrR family transcriptional regulator [Agromyces sp. MMS24-K17]|uniref:TetR/AcrR family transcriptional regulator n=1 Tax=Agromyces sp. MMS24-K17 TaxID=3372850 RepID=UPI0037545CAE